MIVGIDLGTTHSLVGIHGLHGPQLIPNAFGHLLTPSVVAFSETQGLLVGTAAREYMRQYPASGAASFKRWMGTPRTVQLGPHAFRAEELSSLVLRSLLEDARVHLGQDITEAVISVPAYFGDAQRRATRAAGELAGIRVERLINEPTAAAIAYGLQERLDGTTFMVLDLGGGTFDVSIVEMFDGVLQVHASAGDNHLGGDDFLALLVQACYADLGLKPDTLSLPDRAQLIDRLERAKRELSRQTQVHVELTIAGQPAQWDIDEERFEQLAEPLLQRLRAPIERALRDARLDPQQLDEILLVGGASRMRMTSRLAARVLGRLPLRHVAPDQAIGLGTCLMAAMKMRSEAMQEIVLTDVCPYSLGLSIGRGEEHGQVTMGHFQPLIERNTTIPASRAQTIFPIQDGQREILIEVLQGESPLASHNVALGQLCIPLPAFRRRGDCGVEVRFTYDINGVLQVEALSKIDQTRHELIIDDAPGVLTETQIRQRLEQLASLKVHPRDDQANLALVGRIERLYEEHLALRETLQSWLAWFRGLLEGQEPEQILKARIDLGLQLDMLERIET